VAIFTEKHYEDVLKRNKNYQNGNYVEGLRESFLQLDEELEKESG
jgi:hypothetical protein